jgi:hypothetical protein
MTVTAAPPERFDMGRVISAGFGLLARRPLPVLLLALLLGYLPAVVVSFATAQLAGPAPQPGIAPDLGATFQRLGVLESIAFVAAGFSWILHGGVAVVATADAAGRSGETRSQLSMLLSSAPLIFVAGIVATFAIFLGTLLLIVPGILLSLAWVVGPAVAAVEGKGFADMFRRSAELTRGHRGALFLIALLLGIAGGALSFGLRFAVGVPMLATGGALPPLFTFVLQPALSAAFGAISASVYAAAYLELRGVKEGFAAGSAASVFD